MSKKTSISEMKRGVGEKEWGAYICEMSWRLTKKGEGENNENESEMKQGEGLWLPLLVTVGPAWTEMASAATAATNARVRLKTMMMRKGGWWLSCCVRGCGGGKRRVGEMGRLCRFFGLVCSGDFSFGVGEACMGVGAKPLI